MRRHSTPPKEEMHVVFKTALNIEFWNTNGVAHILAGEKTMHMMNTKSIHMLLLPVSAVHVNTSSTEMHDNYTYIFQKSLNIGKAIFSNSRKYSLLVKISIIMGRRKTPRNLPQILKWIETSHGGEDETPRYTG